MNRSVRCLGAITLLVVVVMVAVLHNAESARAGTLQQATPTNDECVDAWVNAELDCLTDLDVFGHSGESAKLIRDVCNLEGEKAALQKGCTMSAVASPCPRLNAPAPAIQAAIANPTKLNGWGKPANPGLRYNAMFNRYRLRLGLQFPGRPYNPQYNALALKAGCP